MNDSERFNLKDAGRRIAERGEPQQRAVGSPLPVGSPSPRSGIQGSGAQSGAQRPGAVPPLRHSLSNSPTTEEPPSGPHWALNVLRGALPFVQRILPLLDGNIGTAVSNILAPHPHPHPQPPPPQVNLEPLEDGLAELRTQHRDLRNQIVEQNSSLKRVEDQLEMVREATDRNTLEQQELLEDLKAVGKKINRFAWLALALLAVSIALNVVLYLHIKRVLH